jgi:hypothetical protein
MDWHIVRSSIRLVNGDAAHSAAVPGDRRHQLLLGNGRNPGRPIPAAGEERLPRQRAGGDAFPRIFSVGVAVGSILINRLWQAA